MSEFACSYIDRVGALYLVNVALVRPLAERVAVVNVGQLLQHFPNLLGEVEIGGGEANRNLSKPTTTLVSTCTYAAIRLDGQDIRGWVRTHRCGAFHHAENRCSGGFDARQRTRKV